MAEIEPTSTFCDAQADALYDPTWLFKDAAAVFLEYKGPSIAEKTASLYKQYLRGLNAHFGELRLQDITIHVILSYRSKRQSRAGAGLINHEINAVAQILALAGQWKRIAPYYKQMKVKSTGPGRAITREEATHLFKVASSRPKWKVAYLASLIGANTACGPGELSRVKLSDIDSEEGVLRIVEGTKNNHRQRSIPLNEDARWAIGELLGLGREKGACLPDHYLIPPGRSRPGQLPDPTRHVTSWKKAWYSLRAEAAKHYPGLTNLRSYDLRHTAATMLAENPNVSEGVLKDILGHGPYSRLAQDHYSHVRMGPRRGAVDSLSGLRPDSPKPIPQQIIPHRLSGQEDALDILRQAQMGAWESAIPKAPRVAAPESVEGLQEPLQKAEALPFVADQAVEECAMGLVNDDRTQGEILRARLAELKEAQ